MRVYLKIAALFFVIAGNCPAFVFYTWNMKHLGRKDHDLERVGSILQDGDLIVLQEVNKSFEGLKRLRELKKVMAGLNEKAKFCIGLSKPSTGALERYAMIWNEANIIRLKADGKKNAPAPCEDGESTTLELVTHLEDKIDREPAYAVFGDVHTKPHKAFTAFTYHAVPDDPRRKKLPREEVPLAFQAVDYHTKKERVIFAGDFNLTGADKAFDEAKDKLDFKPVFHKYPKTSLKSSEKKLSEAYDNVFVRNFDFDPEKQAHKVVNLYVEFPEIAASTIFNRVSDHCPLRVEFNLEQK